MKWVEIKSGAKFKNNSKLNSNFMYLSDAFHLINPLMPGGNKKVAHA